MQISENTVVKITYELYVNDEIIEVAGEDDPMFFLFGMSGLPPMFEKNLEGLKTGDSFNFDVKNDGGYGELDEEAIVDFPIEQFAIEDGEIPDGLLEIGNSIPFSNDEGQSMMGRIIEISKEIVTLDFNHPLAGKDMHFEGTILSIRPATKTEIEHGHVHGEGGVHH
jgi:FKBP-type peptidyl-prolyl cis-trans isomerase SlyD